MSIKLIRPYYEEVQFKNFPNLDQDLIKHFDYIYHSYFPFPYSPRFLYSSGIKFTIRDIYYYIDLLYDNNPTSVIDIGCGECMWKEWFPNITGVDYHMNPWSRVDIVAEVDRPWLRDHYKNYDCGMALNSYWQEHTWQELPDVLHEMMGMVNDRFLFTGPLPRIKNRPGAHLSTEENHESLVEHFTDLLNSLGYNIVLLDYPSHRGVPDWKVPWHDTTPFMSPPHGNARFILEHKKTNG